MDQFTENALDENKTRNPIDEDDHIEEEGILERTDEVEQSLDLPQDKRRVYSDNKEAFMNYFVDIREAI
jgi:hypothetical protein